MHKVTVTSDSQPGYRNQIKAGKHSIVADAPASAGGQESGPDPHDLLLASLGTCTSMTLKMFAAKRGWDLKSVEVDLVEDQIEDQENPGKTKTLITRDIRVQGDLNEEQLTSLRSIADKCPIHKLLVGQKEITTKLNAPVGSAN